jgi:hypothetical protein
VNILSFSQEFIAQSAVITPSFPCNAKAKPPMEARQNNPKKKFAGVYDTR